MAPDTSDKSLVVEVLALVEDMSTTEAGRLIGVSHESVARWRREEFTTLHPGTRRRLKAFVRVHRNEPSRNGQAVHVREVGPEYAPRAKRVGELIEMLSQKDALRRMAQTISNRDLVKAAYAIAIDDGWSEEEMKQLDLWRQEILGDEADPG